MAQIMELSFTSQTKDPYAVGARRVDIIKAAEEAKGYRTYAANKYSEEPDLIVYEDTKDLTMGKIVSSKVIRVYEVTNYGSKWYYVPADRGERYKKSLNRFKDHDCERIFVCSYEENMSSLDGGRNFFESEGIRVDVYGYQD